MSNITKQSLARIFLIFPETFSACPWCSFDHFRSIYYTRKPKILRRDLSCYIHMQIPIRWQNIFNYLIVDVIKEVEFWLEYNTDMILQRYFFISVSLIKSNSTQRTIAIAIKYITILIVRCANMLYILYFLSLNDHLFQMQNIYSVRSLLCTVDQSSQFAFFILQFYTHLSEIHICLKN